VKNKKFNHLNICRSARKGDGVLNPKNHAEKPRNQKRGGKRQKLVKREEKKKIELGV